MRAVQGTRSEMNSLQARPGITGKQIRMLFARIDMQGRDNSSFSHGWACAAKSNSHALFGTQPVPGRHKSPKKIHLTTPCGYTLSRLLTKMP